MQYLSIDFLILYACLGITLFIGLRTGRGIKDIKEYATGNKKFTTGALVLTWLATYICGETILDMVQYSRTNGIIESLDILGCGIAFLMHGFIFAPKFLNFKDCMTMGDVMGTLYKRPSQVITGVLSFCTAICILGMEITILGLLSQTLLGIDFCWGVIIGGGALVLYTVHGGIKSVTYTDIFQCLILLIVLPIITMLALQQAGGIKQVLANLSTTQMQVLHHPHMGQSAMLFILLSIFQIDMIDPALMQRILMAKDKKQLRDQFLISGAFFMAVLASLFLLGLTSVALYPDDSIPYIVPHIIHNILPVGLKGLAFAGVFAITMSTFDSLLHAAGLTLVHDVIAPLYHSNEKRTPFNELQVTRLITLVIGLLVIALGLLRIEHLYGFMELSYLFTGPLLVFPFYAGIMGLKPDRYAFYTASIVTGFLIIFSKLCIPEDYHRLMMLVSICVNGILFLGIHVIRHKGFAIVDYEKQSSYTLLPNPKAWKESLKAYVPTPKNIFAFSKREVERVGAPHILVGIFGAMNYIVPGYMWEHHTVAGTSLMTNFRVVAGLACGILVFKNEWGRRLSHYFPLFWHATLCFCLPFLNTFMLLMTNVSVSWLVNIAMSIMLLIVLVDWTMFFVLSGIGIGLGFLFYTQVVGPIQVDMDFSSGYFLVYQIIFSLLICALFVTRGHRRYARLASEKERVEDLDKDLQLNYLASVKEKIRVVKTIHNGQIKNLPDIMKGIRTLKEQVKKAPNEQVDLALWERTLKDMQKSLTPVAFTMVGLVNRALDYMRLSFGSITLDDLFVSLKRQNPKLQLQLIAPTTHNPIICDPKQLKVLLNNIAHILEAQTQSWVIKIEDTQLVYPVPNVYRDRVKHIPAVRFAISHDEALIPAVEQEYNVQMSGAAIPVTDCEKDILLAINQRIVRSHYGYTNVDISQTTDYDCYTYVIPADLEDIRPKDMNAPVMELGVDMVRADDTYPGAKEQEKEFLDAVATKASVDMEDVEEAIEMIKIYHGHVMRGSGEPFYLHPLAVARIVLDWNQDAETILGALLHDTVEDTPMLLEHVEMRFGPVVRKVVDSVTHFESYQDSFYKAKLDDVENMGMLLQTSDRRALLVKVADRMHNMRTIGGHKSEEKKRAIAKETLSFFVPLALILNIPPYAAEELQIRSEKVLGKIE